jgi:hypothetical protein
MHDFRSAASAAPVLGVIILVQQIRGHSGGHTFIDFALIVGIVFVAGFLPAWLSFHVSRRLLRTRFADEKDM